MAPSLIDNNTGNYIYDTLHRCHENRVKLYSYFFNGMIICFFFILGGITLYLCFCRKLTDSEKQEKMVNDQKMILQKIKALREQNQTYYNPETFTNLPVTQRELSHDVV